MLPHVAIKVLSGLIVSQMVVTLGPMFTVPVHLPISGSMPVTGVGGVDAHAWTRSIRTASIA